MREVFSNQDLTRVSYYKSLLDDADILSFIRNENGGNLDVAGASFQPTLCVITDADYHAALRLLKKSSAKADEARADWTCPKCNGVNPGNFELCWNCGVSAPA